MLVLLYVPFIYSYLKFHFVFVSITLSCLMLLCRYMYTCMCVYLCTPGSFLHIRRDYDASDYLTTVIGVVLAVLTVGALSNIKNKNAEEVHLCHRSLQRLLAHIFDVHTMIVF